ncbi:MAG: SDR family NAD(P)-dependent oxidoreductase [Pseudomonadota bacterium]
MAKSVANWTVLTGSTRGIGSEIAKLLAARGDPMILVNRSEAAAGAQRSTLIARNPDAAIELITADLMDINQVAGAAAKINDLPGQVDVLYNNAGVLTGTKILSAQGFESQFAVNTLAPYQLIQALRAKMARPADASPAMVVLFASSAIKSPKALEVDTLAQPETVGGLLSTYAQTKLAVTALASALADDLKSDNILIRAIDPGATKTEMTTGGNSGMPKLLTWLAPMLFGHADKQAAKLVASADPNAFGRRTGIYVANRKETNFPAAATDAGRHQALVSLLNRLLAAHA